MRTIGKAGHRVGGKADWHKVRAEYIAGGVSQHQLSAKYNIPWSTLQKRAQREKWATERDKAQATIAENAVKKTAEAVSDNAIIAQRIKTKLLKKLEKEIDALPDWIGSELRESTIDNEYLKDSKGKIIGRVPAKTKERSITHKLRDLTAAYKDLTGDMPKEEDNSTLDKLDKLLEVAWNASHE